jgi:hypothetical protein
MSCPSNMTGQGVNRTIGVGNNEGNLITEVALMRPGNVTHAYNDSQRLIWLDKVSSTSTSITVKTPYELGAAPIGDYMLFVLKRETPRGSLCGPSRRIPSVGCGVSR